MNKRNVFISDQQIDQFVDSCICYLMYDSLEFPKMYHWVKKEASRKENLSSKELLKMIPRRQRKFFQNMNPVSYKKCLDLMQALGTPSKGIDSFISFIRLIEDNSPEYLSLKEDYMDLNYIDTWRAAVLYIFKSNVYADRDVQEEYDFLNRTALNVLRDFTDYGKAKVLDELKSKYKSPKSDAPQDFVDFISKMLDIRRRLFLIFDRPLEDLVDETTSYFLLESSATQNILPPDIWKTKIPNKDLRHLIDIFCLMLESMPIYTDAIDEIYGFYTSHKENVDFALKEHSNPMATDDTEAMLTTMLFSSGVNELRQKVKDVIKDLVDFIVPHLTNLLLMYRIMILYTNANQFAHKQIDENFDLRALLDKEREKNDSFDKHKTKDDISLAQKKQEQLNELQIKYDKLLIQYQELKSENDSLKELAEQEDVDLEKEHISDNDKGIVDTAPYPKGTVLFGGHENWQRKFAVVHPEVRIVSGVENFPENVVSPNTPLVLLNSSYMSHKFFYKIRRLQQRHGWKMQFLK